MPSAHPRSAWNSQRKPRPTRTQRISLIRRPLVLLTAAAITTAAAVAVPALAATKSVKVGDNYYVRSSGVPTVTVKKNDTVKWNFAGNRPHNVRSRPGR